MSTASGSDTTKTLENPLSVLTETTSEHEASYRYIQDDDGEYFVAIKDVVGTLLELADKLEGLGGIQEIIGNAFTQVAVQLADPFMDLDQPGALHILPGGAAGANA
ncbi:hypothetical protein [Streptomyces sp. NPDC091879]|uniref:hypothetical protein n=1 Tax=Streptomyces sp. NPDC091879 TaxID=3366006 RepID=UPI0038063E8F